MTNRIGCFIVFYQKNLSPEWESKDEVVKIHICIQIILSEGTWFRDKSPQPKSLCSHSILLLTRYVITRKAETVWNLTSSYVKWIWDFPCVPSQDYLWRSNEMIYIKMTLCEMYNTGRWSCYIVASHFPQLLSLGRKVIYMHIESRQCID